MGISVGRKHQHRLHLRDALVELADRRGEHLFADLAATIAPLQAREKSQAKGGDTKGDLQQQLVHVGTLAAAPVPRPSHGDHLANTADKPPVNAKSPPGQRLPGGLT